MQRQQLELPLGQEEESFDKCLETHPCGERDAVRELMVPREAPQSTKASKSHSAQHTAIWKLHEASTWRTSHARAL